MTVLKNLDGTCLRIELVSQKHGLGISVPYLQRRYIDLIGRI
jgi:hypothetical protein